MMWFAQNKLFTFFIGFGTIILFNIHEINSQAYFQSNATHPNYPGKCYYEGPPVTLLNVGEKKRLSQICVRIECGTGYSLSITGCGIEAPLPHCKVIRGDLRRPYPHCCDEIIC